jgi:hypothetical protein
MIDLNKLSPVSVEWSCTNRDIWTIVFNDEQGSPVSVAIPASVFARLPGLAEDHWLAALSYLAEENPSTDLSSPPNGSAAERLAELRRTGFTLEEYRQQFDAWVSDLKEQGKIL